MIIAYKERGCWGFARVLSMLLASSIAAAVTESSHAVSASDPGTVQRGAIVLVPVPSRERTVRERGHDTTGYLTVQAARKLRSIGVRTLPVSLLKLRVGVADQAGLGAVDRSANLRGSMFVPHERVRRLVAREVGPYRVVICDDVLTTGATAAEAQRALTAIGLQARGIATVAATRRSQGPRRFP